MSWLFSWNSITHLCSRHLWCQVTSNVCCCFQMQSFQTSPSASSSWQNVMWFTLSPSSHCTTQSRTMQGVERRGKKRIAFLRWVFHNFLAHLYSHILFKRVQHSLTLINTSCYSSRERKKREREEVGVDRDKPGRLLGSYKNHCRER